MGQDKAELTLPDGTRFIDHAIERAERVADEVCLVGTDRYHTKRRIFEDSLPRRGPVVGVVTALEVAQREAFDACLVTPVDMPMMTADDLHRLKQAWQREPQLPVCAVNQQDRRRQPLAAIYPVVLHAELRQVAESEHRSLMRWLRHHEHRQVILPAKSCCNINTPDDLHHSSEIP